MKFKTVFVCQKCGYESPKWAGKCPECGEWNTLAEEVKQQESKKEKRTRSFTDFSSEIIKLSDSRAVKETRIPTGIGEFDRLLGRAAWSRARLPCWPEPPASVKAR